MKDKVEAKNLKKRPKVLKGYTYRHRVGCGKLYITINEDKDNNIYEVFAKLGKSGSCAGSQVEALTRMITLLFRMNGDPKFIYEHLSGIRCPEPYKDEEGHNLSCSDAISNCIEEHLKEKNEKNG